MRSKNTKNTKKKHGKLKCTSPVLGITYFVYVYHRDHTDEITNRSPIIDKHQKINNRYNKAFTVQIPKANVYIFAA